jgi:hypothetical protein
MQLFNLTICKTPFYLIPNKYALIFGSPEQLNSIITVLILLFDVNKCLQIGPTNQLQITIDQNCIGEEIRLGDREDSARLLWNTVRKWKMGSGIRKLCRFLRFSFFTAFPGKSVGPVLSRRAVGWIPSRLFKRKH